jgi:hypothetical protein
MDVVVGMITSTSLSTVMIVPMNVLLALLALLAHRENKALLALLAPLAHRENKALLAHRENKALLGSVFVSVKVF